MGVLFSSGSPNRPARSSVFAADDAPRDETIPLSVTEKVPPVVQETPLVEASSSLQQRTRKTDRPRKKTAWAASAPMLMLLQRDLGLTADQLRHFRAVLKEREGPVEILRQEIEDSRVFSTSKYERLLISIRERSYATMGTCLDSLQYRKFQEIRAEGGFGDALVLELPEGIEIRQ